ncbi:MAG: hypothetical protein KC910_29860, partial [Candidatus Eremiobacteraeota bacterium]|nr:hypothetical protein [Candidatus Eremiobacteraeota bacterium]
MLAENFDGLRDALRQADGRCRAVGVDEGGRLIDLSVPTVVYLVGRMDGIWSGLVVDLAFTIKHVLGAARVSIQASLSAPLDTGSDYRSRRERANFYAFLQELDSSSQGAEAVALDWAPGRTPVVTPPPFDHCVFVRSHAELAAELAAQIVADYSQVSFAEYRRSLRVNLRQFIGRLEIRGSGLVQRLLCRFGSTAYANFGINQPRMLKACSLKLGVRVLDYLQGHDRASDALLLEVLERHRVLPEPEQLLAALSHPQGKGEPDGGRNKGLECELWNRRSAILTELRNQDFAPHALVAWARRLGEELEDPTQHYGRMIELNRQSMHTRLARRAGEVIASILGADELGLEGCRKLLERIHHQLQHLRQRWTRELEGQKEPARQRSVEVQRALTEVARAAGVRDWFGRRQRGVMQAAEIYLELLLCLGRPRGALQYVLREKVLRAGLELCDEFET